MQINSNSRFKAQQHTQNNANSLRFKGQHFLKTNEVPETEEENKNMLWSALSIGYLAGKMSGRLFYDGNNNRLGASFSDPLVNKLVKGNLSVVKDNLSVGPHHGIYYDPGK